MYISFAFIFEVIKLWVPKGCSNSFPHVLDANYLFYEKLCEVYRRHLLSLCVWEKLNFLLTKQ